MSSIGIVDRLYFEFDNNELFNLACQVMSSISVVDRNGSGQFVSIHLLLEDKGPVDGRPSAAQVEQGGDWKFMEIISHNRSSHF